MIDGNQTQALRSSSECILRIGQRAAQPHFHILTHTSICYDTCTE
jgi:hypothetical protein